MARTPCLAFLAMLALTGTSAAGMRTAQLPVKMSYPMADPPVFEQLLLRISGVRSVEVSFDEQSAMVTYDDAEASESDFTAALRK